ncbi:MAG: TIGR03088 family PEP-CTERM/XrtA system glycosyltransferase [Gammaproteobacteria bacterium]|nr:TIGR03088 family PEP-CTERM/XrtA system glycosyltransferase [Gammaproteobacteria bacterium]
MAAPLVVHIIHRLAIGGLENGLVNLINHMPEERYRHAIVCMTQSSDFRQRIKNPDVAVYELHKQPGHDMGLYFRLWRLLRRLRPAVVHTRNIGTLECQFIALLAGVSARVHGEHGRDMADIDGRNATYLRLRRLFRPLISRYIAVSRDLAQWLHTQAGVPEARVAQIYNGVDEQKFHPRAALARAVLPTGFAPPDAIVVGTIGRLSGEKDQLTLLRAFARARALHPQRELRLVLVGDGPLKAEIEREIVIGNLQSDVWLPGARGDIAEILRALDIFILPSLGEGISNTILEAMASGVAVIATRVGGNPELVVENATGRLVPAADPESMAQAIVNYVQQPEVLWQHAQAGRARIEREYSMAAMVRQYMAVYDAALLRACSITH